MRWKILGGCLLFAAFLFFPLPARAESSAAYAVYDAFSGKFVGEKNADEKRPAASTAKLMTALVAAEEGDLSRKVAITWEDAAVEGSRAYLMPGEEATLEELLCALLLASGNDAASAVARGVAGDAEKFVLLMNRKAEELGLAGTSYENPAGLDGEGQYTTARDLALLTEAAMENETVAGILRKKYFSFGGHTLKNHNRLLWESDACVGGKTGYTKKAGRCLTSVFERAGRRMIAVTLSDPDDWRDHLAFAEEFYRDVEEETVALVFPIRTADFVREEGSLFAVTRLPLRPGEREKLVFAAEAPHFLWKIPGEGEAAGFFRISLGGREIKTGALFFESAPGRRILSG
ncbi:MAG: D-alanyl-D-alanine carboxypeptidase [Clostridia bacterium]|nr:D-alanyl-D-alanine carboxypeptidase [Clostridia bacterium]